VFFIPGLLTHYICGDICLNKLKNSELKNIITKNRQIYNVGTQGPDVFFYYLPCLYRKKWYQLGNTLHKTNVQAFFGAMLNHIEILDNIEQKNIAISYLAGYLTHYSLDYHTHPYIYYRSGFKTDNDRNPKLKYSANHRNFETSIDTLMLKLISSEKPSDRKICEIIRVSRNESMVTAEILSKALKDVYDIDMSGNHIYRAIYSMFTANRLMQSKKGKRKFLMEFIENFTIGEHIISSLIHEQDTKGDIDFLNLKRAPWYKPWDDIEKYECAFTDMFEHAIEEAVKMIESEFEYLNGKISKNEILDIIGNNSLATGMDSNVAIDFKFSDVVYR